MGGSAVGGLLARAALGDRATRRFTVSRDYGLPAWTTPDTTVLCSSYSGNTEETLTAFEAAGALGARRIVCTTGGQLAQQARAESVPVIGVPGGFQPRAAIGYMLVVALEVEGELVAGVVHDPAKDEMFVAEKGRGCWLKGQRLRVAADRDFTRALVATGIPHAGARHRHARYLEMLREVMREAAGIRRMAAAALDLSYVAAGRFAVFFELGLKRWDIAAASLLVREAGGTVSEPDGGDGYLESGDVLATNGRLHEPTLAMLRRATRRSASAKPRSRRSPPG